MGNLTQEKLKNEMASDQKLPLKLSQNNESSRVM